MGNNYYRARVLAINKLIGELRLEQSVAIDADANKRLEKTIRLLRNGFVQESYNSLIDKYIQLELINGDGVGSTPLSFVEISSNKTFFEIHPDKIGGIEKETTSMAFPLTVKGTKEGVVKMLEKYTQINEFDFMELEAEALQLELEMNQITTESLEGNFTTLNGVHELGKFGDLVQSEVDSNLVTLRNVLDRSKDQKDAKPTDKLSFEEVVEKYNEGISKEEIVAWVWYKRSLGVPMWGWEKYFLSTKNGGDVTTRLISTRETILKDNHFREIAKVPANKVLGRPTSKHLEYAGDVYLIFRDDEGLKYVRQADTRVEKTSIVSDPYELNNLVFSGVLYYLNGELLPFAIYGYGNMYDRELQLAKDKEYITKRWGSDIFEKHKEAIVKAKPTPLTVTNPNPNERPKILAISHFAKEFTVNELAEEFGVDLKEGTSLIEAFKVYLGTLSRDDFNDSSAFDIKQYYLDAKRVSDSLLSKDQKQEVKVNARNEASFLFEKFLHEALTFEDQQKLDVTWNRSFNGQSSLPYHKIPVGFEASAKFKQFNLEIRPAQREGVAFMEAVGSGIIAYDVGVGKTLTAIVALANAFQSGKAKRALVVVPKPTYTKWMKEIIGYNDKSGNFVAGILSNTGVKVNDWGNLGTKYRDKVNLNVKVGGKTITLVTYEGFRKIGFSEKVLDELFIDLTNVLAQSKANLSERDQEIEYEKYREKIGVGLKGTIADIDKLGFDFLVIDEAHRCKNIFEGVKKDEEGNKRFGVQGRTSELGIKAFFLCNYLQATYGRNVCLLTATPFTNSPVEIYSMLSLVARFGMKGMGLTNIQRFFEMFVQETTEMVVNSREQIVPKDVIRRFNNRLILQKLIYNHINYKTGDEAGVKRPVEVLLPKTSERRNGRTTKLLPQDQILTYMRMTTKQRLNQNEITEGARQASEIRSNSGAMFRALAASLNNAVSPFLYQGEPEDYTDFVKESPKVEYALECIRSVKEYHEERGESVSGQLIYMNRGKRFFGYIKQYLDEEVGFKTDVKFNRSRLDEVEIISGDTSDIKKENIKEGFLAGVVKVVIGTSTIREGIDLQTFGTTIYVLTPDWNPTDLSQLKGRFIRQGNTFAFVRVVLPLAQDSMDVFVYQKLSEKTSRINDIWYRADRGNVMDVDTLDPEEVKFALLTDIEAIANFQLRLAKKEKSRKLEIIKVNIAALGEYHRNLEDLRLYRASCIEVVTAWINGISSHWSIVKPPSKEKLRSLTADQRRMIETLQLLFDSVRTFLERTPQEDKELLKLGRKLEGHGGFYESFKFDLFKEYLSKVKKAEKTILASKGFTAQDDLEEALKEFREDEQRAQKELDHVNSPVFFSELKQEAQEKKSAMQIEGKTVADRVKDFASLNYLLSFSSDYVTSKDGELPSPLQEKSAQAFDLEILELEAFALELELELVSFAA